MNRQSPLFEDKMNLPPLATQIERNGTSLNIPEGIDTIPLTHGMHRFPGKFIPNIPRYLFRTILKSRKGKSIFDPFCGSGTALVEAAIEGKPFFGMDIDPLAVMLARVKATPLAIDEIASLEDFWGDYQYTASDNDYKPKVPNLNHWFTDRAITELSAIKAGCIMLPQRQRDFSLVVFSSIIRRVSNADDQTQKTYVSGTLKKNPPLPSKLFPIFMDRALRGMNEYRLSLPQKPVGQITVGDARFVENITFDDVLTSPPYIDSIDYVYNQMLEYFWLLEELGIGTYEGYRAFRKRPMGFSQKVDQEIEIIRKLLPTTIDNKLQELFDSVVGRSLREANAILSFFCDLYLHCKCFHKLQKPGAIYICIIGNSTIRRVLVPTVNLSKEIFLDAGYNLEDMMNYEIRRHYMKFPRRENSGTIREDEIMIFRR